MRATAKAASHDARFDLSKFENDDDGDGADGTSSLSGSDEEDAEEDQESEEDNEDEDVRDISKGTGSSKRRRLVNTVEPSKSTGKKSNLSGLPQFTADLSSESSSSDDDDDDDDDGVDEDDEPEPKTSPETRTEANLAETSLKRKRVEIASLTPEALADLERRKAASGVIYLSRVPPFMKPTKVRHLLAPFGEIGRIFLAPEDDRSYARRVKSGGNKRRRYVEGWIEFADRRRAKLVARTLNTRPVGSTASVLGAGRAGKKERFYADDLWNLKYLPKFKWDDLTAQIAGERRAQEAKLRSELLQQEREDRHVVRQQQKHREVEAIKRTRQRRAEERQAEGKQPLPEKLRPTENTGAQGRGFRQNVVMDRAAAGGGDAAVAKPINKSSGGAHGEPLQKVLDSIF
ncbi:RNA-binding ATPase activator esf2 [Savitreella phatthalungensis]